MSRKLLIGTTEYTWPNDGDLEWGQEVYDWAQAISQAVTEGGSGEGIPDGGSVGQVLKKRSSDDYDVFWGSPAEYRAGTGLRLSGGRFSIDDEGVTYELIDNKIAQNFFGAPISGRAYGTLPFRQYDVYPADLFNSADIWMVDKSANRIAVYGNAATGFGRQSTFSRFTVTQSDSTSEFGTASNGTYAYRPLVVNETITELHAYGKLMFHREDGNITLSEAIPGVTGTSTSLAYSYQQSVIVSLTTRGLYAYVPLLAVPNSDVLLSLIHI